MDKYYKSLLSKMNRYPSAKVVIIFPRKQGKTDEFLFKIYKDAHEKANQGEGE